MSDANKLNDQLSYILKRYVSDVTEEGISVYYEDYMFKIEPYAGDWKLLKYNRIPREDMLVEWSDVCCLQQVCNFEELINIFIDEDQMLDKAYSDIPAISKEDFDLLIKHSREERTVEKFEVMKTIPNDDLVVKCLCCEKEIKRDKYGCLDYAGYAYIEFHYGSRHDQGKGFGGCRLYSENPTREEILLACDNIEAYICDDCFDKKQDLMKGFVKVSHITHERKA